MADTTPLMGVQNSDAVNITGGAINGTPIGATTPSTAAFSTLTATSSSVGSQTSTGINATSIATTISASATQTRVGGTALIKQVNNVTTVGTSGDAVTLPALTAGQFVDVYNSGANPMSVFPNGASDTIDGGSAGAAVTLTNAKRSRFTCFATNTIISAQLGAVSA